MDTLVAPGEHDVTFLSSQKRTTFGRNQWLLIAQLVPPAEPALISWWVNIPRVAHR